MGDDAYVRGLRRDEWEALRAIRLEAVEAHPDYFTGTVEKTLSLPQEEWQRRIESDRSRSFGLFLQDQLIGITGIYVPEDDPASGGLCYTYIQAKHRGKGYAHLFYPPRIAWAKDKNLQRIKTGHRSGNAQSRGTILSQGFVYVGTEDVDWPDGSVDAEVKYELDLGEES